MAENCVPNCDLFHFKEILVVVFLLEVKYFVIHSYPKGARIVQLKYKRCVWSYPYNKDYGLVRNKREYNDPPKVSSPVANGKDGIKEEYYL